MTILHREVSPEKPESSEAVNKHMMVCLINVFGFLEVFQQNPSSGTQRAAKCCGVKGRQFNG